MPRKSVRMYRTAMLKMAKINPAIANFVSCFGIVLYGVYGLNCLGEVL